jgi:8-oxo-dGTP pyrophosphatase MutT (NUDIX family)
MPTPRRAARLLLVDPEQRVLLLKLVHPDRGTVWWTTPGGGLNPGETHQQAAQRELQEEVGLRDATIGPALWRNQRYFRQRGQVFFQEEMFFLARVEPFEVDMSGRDVNERENQVDHRWWTLDEIRASTENIYPRGLATLLAELLENGPPPEPIAIKG